MAWTQPEYDTLRAAVASGVLTVTYDGPPRRSVTYQSLEAMRALLSEMQRDLLGANAPTVRYAQVRKGT